MKAKPSKCMQTAFGALLSAAGAVCLSYSAGAATITNGDFETPVVQAGSYSDFGNGSTGITGWTVVGGSDVDIINRTFDNPYEPAESGQQWLDLTGIGSGATAGVEQSVATTPGQGYTLSFWVGDQRRYGSLSSTVDLKIDGTHVYSATNTNPTGSATEVWQEFLYTFVAATGSTTIGFFNADPTGDTSNGLDNVSIAEAAGTTPLPAALPLFASGLGGLGLLGWRRKRKKPA